VTKEHYIPKTALVACSRLVDFAGSEIVTLEIAEALRDLGVKVKLAALEVGPAIASEIRLLDIECVDLSASRISGMEFDLIWVSHYTVAYHLIINEGIRAKIGVFSSLSHFEPIETPPLPFLLFSRYTVNSDENLFHFNANYDYFKDRVGVFPNAAPARFFDAYQKSVEGKIESIAIVSNHLPGELADLITRLQKEGINVDLIGIQGTRLRVTPSVLSGYSAVITIGKTVQYCLAMGIPVFCYDHFGGPGWITLESFELAFVKNFSGRCTPFRRTSDGIASEISLGFAAVLNQREALRDLAQTHFDLSKNLLDVLVIANNASISVSLSETEGHILSRESCLFLNQRRVIANSNNTLAERDNQIADLNNTLAERDNRIADLNNTLAERDLAVAQAVVIRASTSWRLMAPLRLVGHLMRGNFGIAACAVRNRLIRIAQRLPQPVRSLTCGNHTLGERDNQISGFKVFTGWKMTAPMKRLLTYINLLRANLRTLLVRTAFVSRNEGVLSVVRRTISFIMRYLKRKLGKKQFERFKRNMGTAISCDAAPLVSFVIPIYDRTSVLQTAINSALGQSLQVFEVILVTDGSPPSTLAVVELYRSDPRVRIFNYPVSSGNAVRGRNKGILEARGRYIAFLDSDDVAAPDRLEVCLPILESGQADVIYGGWRAILDGTREINELTHGQEVYSPDCDLALLEQICVPCQSTVMVRREALLRTGLLKPKMQYREDHELWTRLAYHGAIFKSVPRVLADLRLHSGNNELKFKDNDAHWKEVLREEYHLPGPIPKKIVFLLAGLGISGGTIVILKHVSMLMESGHDAFIIDLSGCGDISWFGNPAIRVYPIEQMHHCGLDNIDLLFATFWTTASWLRKIPARRKLYLVQSDERLFYEDAPIKAQVADTYRQDYEYVVIAQWLGNMLREEFGKVATYVPNGLDIKLFYPGDPLEAKHPQRLRVLIEGPISVPFKGVAESYAAVHELDCDLWIVSTDGKPGSDWHYDRFFERVNPEAMRRIYSSCDILLKMSRVESFAYPPLEAMACGCAVVLGEVNGGIEYAINEVNVIKVPQGDIPAARAAVQKLLVNEELRDRLIQAGLETVKCWSWETSRKSMLAIVESGEITRVPTFESGHAEKY
jgi:O-antigen biosynthesis protein